MSTPSVAAPLPTPTTLNDGGSPRTRGHSFNAPTTALSLLQRRQARPRRATIAAEATFANATVPIPTILPVLVTPTSSITPVASDLANAGKDAVTPVPILTIQTPTMSDITSLLLMSPAPTSDVPLIQAPVPVAVAIRSDALSAQIIRLVEAESIHLKRLELLRDAYWTPLQSRYGTTPADTGTGRALCSVAWSSTSGEEDEDEEPKESTEMDAEHASVADSAIMVASPDSEIPPRVPSPPSPPSTSIEAPASDSTSNASRPPLRPRTSSLALSKPLPPLPPSTAASTAPAPTPPVKRERSRSFWSRFTSQSSDIEVPPVPPLPVDIAAQTSTDTVTSSEERGSNEEPSPDNNRTLFSAISSVFTSEPARPRLRSTTSSWSLRPTLSRTPSMASLSRAPSIASIQLYTPSVSRRNSREGQRRAPVRLCDAIRPYQSIGELLAALFDQLVPLITLQEQLVKALQQLDPESATHRNVALAYLGCEEHFQAYTDYAAGHATALAALENLRLTNPRFRRHLRHMQLPDTTATQELFSVDDDEDPHYHGMTATDDSLELTRMLQWPFQHIWYYVDVFETLRRHAVQSVPLGERQPTLAVIQELMDTLDSLDLRMNTYQRQIERVGHIARLQRTVRHLPTLLLTDRQSILHEGEVRWRNSTTVDGKPASIYSDPIRAYCWLLRDRLILAHPRASGTYTHKCTIRLAECAVYALRVDFTAPPEKDDVSPANNTLHILTQQQSIRLYIDGQREFDRWCGQVRVALVTLPRDKRPSHQRHGSILSQEVIDTVDGWTPVHAGQYIHVEALPVL